MPELFRKKRHYRMEQPQCRFEACEEVFPCNAGSPGVRTLQVGLDPLDVPVAEVAPEKLIDFLRCFVESVVFQRLIDRFDGFIEAREEPLVCNRYSAVCGVRRICTNLRCG